MDGGRADSLFLGVVERGVWRGQRAGAPARMACRGGARHRRLWMAGCTRTAVGAYGTGVGWCAPVTIAGGVHGLPAALMGFAGRAGPVREVGGLLEDCRLVTVTGRGGWRRTRLTGEGRAAGGGWVRGRGVAGGSAGPCAGGPRRVPGRLRPGTGGCRGGRGVLAARVGPV
jgi:hypothetical protein